MFPGRWRFLHELRTSEPPEAACLEAWFTQDMTDSFPVLSVSRQSKEQQFLQVIKVPENAQPVVQLLFYW